MKAEIHESNATDLNQSDDNLSMAELIAQASQVETDEPTEEVEETEEAPEVADEEEEEIGDGLDLEVEADDDELEEADDEESEEETESDEGDDIDRLLGLDESQIKELAAKGKSRLLNRVGELTARAKAAEAEAEALRTRQPARADGVPSDYKALKSAEEIDAKYSEFQNILKATDKLLRDYATYDEDDDIDINGQTFTKAQVVAENERVREGLNKHLPNQQRNLIRMDQYSQASQMYESRAKEEVPEIQDEESEVGKKYKELIADPLVRQLQEELPELGVQIKYVLAHAANSIFGKSKKSVPNSTGKKLKVKPPASPVSARSAPRTNAKGKANEAMQRFEQSGSMEDWIAAQTAKS